MKIYIVRHGETLANKDGLLQGWIDTPLSPLGVSLAEETGEGLKDVKFDAAFSSPLKRAVDTAKIVLSKNNYKDTPIYTDERIKEVHLGDWEGKKFKGEGATIPQDEVNQFFTNPFKLGRVPGGEKATEVCERAQSFIKELSTKNYDNVLIATHGFALRAMLNFVYENKEDFWQGHVPYNCSVSILEYKNNKFTLLESDKIYYDNSEIHDRYSIK